jgi:hypothetical protein
MDPLTYSYTHNENTSQVGWWQQEWITIHCEGCPDHDEESQGFPLRGWHEQEEDSYFIAKYVARAYGSHHIQLLATKNQNRAIFDLINMPDLVYTVAVIENSHEIWEQCNEGQNISSKIWRERWEIDQEESSTKKTPKFTKRTGNMREYNTLGWNHEGIHFFNKVCREWKKLASKNKEGTREQLEAEWNEYIEDNNSLYFYRRSRKRKLNYSTDCEDMPPLPTPTLALEIRLDANDDYMPDCPWKRHGFDNDSPSSQYMNRVSVGGNDLTSV